jgi:fimbrial chaperone protein
MLGALARRCLLASPLLLVPRLALASEFDVAPVMVELSEKASSATVVLTNRDKQPLRFHVTAFAWSQREDGEMALEATKDIVFFPAMLVLNPKESRQIRVGTKVKPGSVERSYRLFVEELPPLKKQDEAESNQVRMLTKMSLPVFVRALQPKAAASLTTLALKGRELRFSIKNTGNAHMRVQKVLLSAKAAGKTIHEQELPGWYVLAAGVRTYEVTLPDAVCHEAAALEVRIESDGGAPKATLASARCSP